ncbi:hypothetical protein EVAR_11309_1 [Eumeta japonica]|uniref:Uncharacterized protein n=1 Tax=Eumeta variegata TaxID=151549 RepID=A0A4C1U0W3_EUMVA|nr:hypothetical protein EVAR_11309_1 [Eumeta japonica]
MSQIRGSERREVVRKRCDAAARQYPRRRVSDYPNILAKFAESDVREGGRAVRIPGAFRLRNFGGGKGPLRLGVTLKSVTLGNVTMSHRTREPAECLASLSHSTMIGLPRAALEN